MTRLVLTQQPGAERRPPNFLTVQVVLPPNGLLPRCDACSGVLMPGKLAIIWVPRVRRILPQYAGHPSCLFGLAADAPLDVQTGPIQ